MTDADETTGDADAEPVRTLADPTLAEARDHVERAAERGDLVTAFGTCSVEYEGRAESHLGPGERHIMFKPDGTLLVHGPEGHQPVNWQPPGGELDAAVEGDRFRLTVRRPAADSRVDVRFERVRQATAFPAGAGAEREISGTEEDLRRRILADPDLVEAGFRPLATERDTAAGAIDVFGKDADGNAVAVELKRRRVGPSAVGQLDRYVAALRRELHADAGVRGVLVAPSVTPRARRMLAERGMDFVSLAP